MKTFDLLVQAVGTVVYWIFAFSEEGLHIFSESETALIYGAFYLLLIGVWQTASFVVWLVDPSWQAFSPGRRRYARLYLPALAVMVGLIAAGLEEEYAVIWYLFAAIGLGMAAYYFVLTMQAYAATKRREL